MLTKAQHDPARYSHSPESQQYPEQDQQGEGGASAPLLHAGDTPPGLLHPALGSSVQERLGPVEADPVRDMKLGAILPQKMNRTLEQRSKSLPDQDFLA